MIKIHPNLILSNEKNKLTKQKQYNALKNIYNHLDKLIIENSLKKEDIQNIRKDKSHIHKTLVVIENQLNNS